MRQVWVNISDKYACILKISLVDIRAHHIYIDITCNSRGDSMMVISIISLFEVTARELEDI